MCLGLHHGAWGLNVLVLVGKGRQDGWERNYTILLKASLTSGNEPRKGEDEAQSTLSPGTFGIRECTAILRLPQAQMSAAVPQGRRWSGR